MMAAQVFCCVVQGLRSGKRVYVRGADGPHGRRALEG